MILKSQFDTMVVVGEDKGDHIEIGFIYTEPTEKKLIELKSTCGKNYTVITPDDVLNSKSYQVGINGSLIING